jgi:outer membrane protein OmpA-like peptidoglycan-associated protein
MKSLLLVVALGGIAAADNAPDFVSAKAPKSAVTLPASNGRGQIEPTDMVMFDSNSSQLNDVATDEIDRAAVWLAAHPGYNLAIEGHTDEAGTTGYNAELAFARANAVRDRLAAHGVAADRLVVVGYGEQGASAQLNKNDRHALFFASKLAPADLAARSIDRGAQRATWFAQGSPVDMQPRR